MAPHEQSNQTQAEQHWEEMAWLKAQLAPCQASSPFNPILWLLLHPTLPHLIKRLRYGRITGSGFKYVWR